MFNWVKYIFPLIAILGSLAITAKEKASTNKSYNYGYYYGIKFNFGASATRKEIVGWDRDVRFDGAGALDGSGSVEEGEPLYEAQCAVCHGSFGEGEGRWPKLAGGNGSLKNQLTSRPEKTVGSYWPYAGTLLDYIYRAMPYTAPKSLTPNQAYAITAYVLSLNDIVDDDFVLDKESLKKIRMPNVDNFIFKDPRPDTKNTLCMRNCKKTSDIKLIEHIKGVTPTDHLQVKNTDQVDTMSDKQDNKVVFSERAKIGETLYRGKCDVCHKSGVGNSPKIGASENKEWESRYSNGLEAIFKNAIDGFQGDDGFMPEKGGYLDLSDDEIKNIVLYMLEESGISSP